MLLELMSKLVLERVDETERKTLAQLESLRRIALSQQGRSEEKERLEDERALKKPLAERLPGLPIIPHTELEFAEAHASFNLGKGGFGCVVKGKWLRQGRLPVAVKLPYKLDVDPIERARFEEEVALLYKLRGELNVVSMLAVCLEAGHEAIVMRLMQGGNLFHRLQQARKDPATRGLSWEKKLDIAMDIVRGVNALHMLPAAPRPRAAPRPEVAERAAGRARLRLPDGLRAEPRGAPAGGRGVPYLRAGQAGGHGALAGARAAGAGAEGPLQRALRRLQHRRGAVGAGHRAGALGAHPPPARGGRTHPARLPPAHS